MDQLLQAGPQPNPPGPTTPVFNPLLDDKMAALENALQSLLLSRRDGLDKLAVQLPQDDSLVKDAIGDGLKFGVGKMLDAMTDGIAAVLTVYSSGLISAFAAGGAQFAKSIVAPTAGSGDAQVSLAEFVVPAPRKAITDHSFRVQQDYLTTPALPGGEVVSTTSSRLPSWAGPSSAPSAGAGLKFEGDEIKHSVGTNLDNVDSSTCWTLPHHSVCPPAASSVHTRSSSNCECGQGSSCSSLMGSPCAGP